MKSKRVLSSLFVLLLVSGCNRAPEPFVYTEQGAAKTEPVPLVGKWLSADESIEHEFQADGTYRGHFKQVRIHDNGAREESGQFEQGSFTIGGDGKKLSITGDLFGENKLQDAAFRIDSLTDEMVRLVRASDGEAFVLHFVPPAPNAVVAASGHGGDSSSQGPKGRHRIAVPFLQEDGRCVFVGMMEHPEHPLAPSFLLGLRVLDANSVGANGSGGSSGERQFWNRNFAAAGDNTVRIEYELNDTAEKLAIDGREYDFVAGRVFILDLTTEPPTIQQTRLELAEILPIDDSEGKYSRDALRIALHRLRNRSQVVAGWWPE